MTSLTLKEFFIIRETGQMLFHHRFRTISPQNGDPLLTSGLLAAIFQFAQQVEQDLIDFIRMRRVSFIFRKSSGLIFVLSMSSDTNPVHFEEVMHGIEKQFFLLFPEAAFDPSSKLDTYEGFRSFLSDYLKPVEKRAILLSEVMFVLGVKEELLVEWSLEEIGSAVANKVFSVSFDEIQLAQEKSVSQLLEVAETILGDLGINIQPIVLNEGTNTIQIQLNHSQCQLYRSGSEDCFCRGFLDEFLGKTVDFAVEIRIIT